MEALITALETAFGTMATDAMSAIGKVAPIALPLMGAVIVLTIAAKVFKRVAGK